jgi:hypothetical protein
MPVEDAGRLFFADFHNRGLDYILKFLFRLVPYNEALTIRVNGDLGIPEFNGFNLIGFPMFEGHELSRHYRFSLVSFGSVGSVMFARLVGFAPGNILLGAVLPRAFYRIAKSFPIPASKPCFPVAMKTCLIKKICSVCPINA